jgi:hypothetical protein
MRFEFEPTRNDERKSHELRAHYTTRLSAIRPRRAQPLSGASSTVPPFDPPESTRTEIETPLTEETVAIVCGPVSPRGPI